MKYRLKSQSVVAVKYDGTFACLDVFPSQEVFNFRTFDDGVVVPSPERLKAQKGEYIMRDSDGNYFVCPGDIFEKLYEENNVEDEKNSDAEMFKNITDDMLSVYKAKNADYGNAFSRLFDEYGMLVPLIHIKEKLYRVDSLMDKENKVEGETYLDSIKDLAIYAVLTIIEILQRKMVKDLE